MGNNPISRIDPDGGSDGWFVDEDGNRLGWDGINDDKEYLVTKIEDKVIIATSILFGKNYTSHSSLSKEIYLMPSFNMRQELKSKLFTLGKSDVTREHSGTFRGTWSNNLFIKGRSGGVFKKGAGKASTKAYLADNVNDLKLAVKMGIDIQKQIMFTIHTHNVVSKGSVFAGIPTNPSDYDYLKNGEVGIILETRKDLVYIHNNTKGKYATMKSSTFFNAFK